MILFFRAKHGPVLALETFSQLSCNNIDALKWLFGEAELFENQSIEGYFIGPRKEMITPWSTSAVEITRNMNIEGIRRIEEYYEVERADCEYDKMLQRLYTSLDQDIFKVEKEPEVVKEIIDIAAYNEQEGLALSADEVEYLEKLSQKIGRPLTDGEVFGFSQVNSEHCRHKIFNGKFVINGNEMESTLFQLIKKTSKENPNRIVSAYKDNCAFIEGPEVEMFLPERTDTASLYKREAHDTVISLKAETHNFPTTVEPFNGAATGSGGEIRDRMAGGRGSFPIAGTAVYMTSYPRFDVEDRDWEYNEAREWLYQTPEEILIKASNGASDFGNKFGQPLICGSLLTMEFLERYASFGYDKVIMLAGGVGYARRDYVAKGTPEAGEKVVLLGGDNYRIGMGGGAVSSVATGEYDNAIELNAVQRSNPEMQKRVYNAIRALAERDNNTIVSIHDHGAGGHLNCLSELVEEAGGNIDIDKLPVGDPTLSAKEIIGNESQERMGLVMRESDTEEFKKIAERERAPVYIIGETTGEKNFTLKNSKTGETPIDLALEDMFGSAPKTVMEDNNYIFPHDPLEYDIEDIEYYLAQVMQLESVACKDWLTNKVDRSVTGLIAAQQTVGEIQLPLSNLGVTQIGYGENRGIATSIGHAPGVALISPEAGSRIAIAESLTNLVWTPITGGIRGVSLSANWMWPCRNPGQDARLYRAVRAASDFAIELGINIPTGKDSLSMTQKYSDEEKVLSPGTVIISTVCQSDDVTNVVKPPIIRDTDSAVIYIPFSHISEDSFALGGSAFAQITNQLGDETPDIRDAEYFAKCFEAVQKMVSDKLLLAGHDVSAGGLVTALLEMNFANTKGGFEIDLSALHERDAIRVLFSENPAVVIQVKRPDIPAVEAIADEYDIIVYQIGGYQGKRELSISAYKFDITLNIDKYRNLWYRTSYLFDTKQSGERLAAERYGNYKVQPLRYKFPENFSGMNNNYGNRSCSSDNRKITAAVIREKGSNGEREMAWSLFRTGFAVKDVHMTDLISGRENLEDVNLIVFVGGFSNADTLGSAKGWAGAFIYNEKAAKAIENFYARPDTLSLGVCNGCQLMAELGLITPENRSKSPKMLHNDSHKYESAFVGVTIEESPAIMLQSVKGASLGIWVSHGEGKFDLPESISEYNIAMRYNYREYPGNPNGSPDGIAAVCSSDGRHLAMMPHPERSLYPYNWAWYHPERGQDEISPWIEIFTDAYKWLSKLF